MCINDTHSSAERTGGFTLVEILVVLAIITIVSGFVFSQHTGLASRSNLQLRASQITEFIQFAQNRSSSSEVLAFGAPEPNRGYQIIRLRVRDGLFRELRLEKAPGDFSSFTSGVGAFGIGNLSDDTIPVVNRLLIPNHEEFYLHVCFIDTNDSNKYHFEPLNLIPYGNPDRNSPCSNLTKDAFCGDLDPVADRDSFSRNNFDVHLSLWQPTREIYANILAVLPRNQNDVWTDRNVRPNGITQRESETYEGVRLVLLTPDGIKRSIDIYRTGLVNTRADDSTDGCSGARTVSSSG